MLQSRPGKGALDQIEMSEREAENHSLSWCKCGHLVMGPEEEVQQPRRVPETELKNGNYIREKGAVGWQEKLISPAVFGPCIPLMRCPWCGAFCGVGATSMAAQHSDLTMGAVSASVRQKEVIKLPASKHKATKPSSKNNCVFLRKRNVSRAQQVTCRKN